MKSCIWNIKKFKRVLEHQIKAGGQIHNTKSMSELGYFHISLVFIS